MTDAVDTATTPVSGTESATSQAVTTEQQSAVTEQGQQQAQQQQQEQQAAAPVVPEAYAFANLPEGYTVSDEQLAAFSPVLKELNLTQEQADKLVAFDAQRQLAAAEAGQQQAVELRNKQVGEWETALRNDAAFGGANFDANVATAQKALADFGTPELTTMLKESGLGSHPEVVRFFHKVGQQLAEGKLHRTTTEVPKPDISLIDAFR
ncbi:hypothetical protein [Pseudomonas sp. Hg5Tf]|uniref:Peptidase n=1 Tax=Pseudomonas sp. Hg7Tf TaxID=3236988 RepID=A0AB39HTC6_9PSED|nr:hypothetical protein [Pseudomonas sp. Hg5Tf]MDH2559004.1 hypothetical protein [Pseudomonas sp. Hg5Tf]